MGRRIEDVTSAEFDALFASFEHTAYRLETLQAYDVSYEVEPYQAFMAGHPRPRDSSKDQWVSMIRDAVAAGKVFQRVHVVIEPLTDYLRYELGWSYPPNVEAGEDIRVLVAQPGKWPMSSRGEILPHLRDYWLFDSSDLWVMEYADDGRFLYIEQVTEPAMIVTAARRRDAALHYAIPYSDYMRRAELLAAS
jgi:hypothetical protein